MYKLELKKTFSADSRQRAGIRLLKGEPVEVEDLEKDQLTALRSDPYITVTSLTAPEPEADSQKDSQPAPAARKMVDKSKSSKKA